MNRTHKITARIEQSFVNFFKRRGIDVPPELIEDLEREAQYQGFCTMMAAVDRISEKLTDEDLKRIGKMMVEYPSRTN